MNPPITQHRSGTRLQGRLLLLVLLLGAAALQGLAQGTGKLRLIIDPGADFQFVLDRKYRMQQREVELLEGPHHFSFWAPTRKVVDTTLTVVPGRVTDFRMRLPYAADHVKYSRELSAWKQQRMLKRGIPLVAAVGGALWTVLQVKAVSDANAQLDADRAAYEKLVLTHEIRTLKEETIPQHNKDADRARTMLGVAGGFTAVAIAGTVYQFIRTAREEAPAYEDKERVRFEGLVWVPGPAGGGLHGSLTIPLAR